MTSITRKAILTNLLALVISFGAAQEANNQEKYRHTIQRISGEIKIDGIVDEKAWQTITPVGEAWYSYPIDDRRVEDELQTEVRIAYDDKNIYVAAICHGKGPFVVNSLKRDNNQFWDGADVFSVSFDPINEKLQGLGFATNPEAVQFDVLFSANTGTRDGGGGGGFNPAWDTKFQTASKTHNDRWVTEMAIPFKSLRYDKQMVWGFNFLRGVSSNNSWHTWAPVPVQLTGVDLGFNGALVWEEPPPKPSKNIAIIPYALGSAFQDIEADEEAEYNFDFGVDSRIALTSQLNLDLTYNPDFSQVDVDQQVTNLTTVNVRFPERRLFFVNNADIFSDFGIPPMRPFFSRRIGLDESNQAIPILYGARLTGNLTNDLRVGVMNLQTKSTQDFDAQNYTNVSFNQRLFGRTILKGYFLNRQAYREGGFSDIDYNRAIGTELEYRSINGNLRVVGGIGMSLSDGATNQRHTYHGIVSYNNRNISFYTNNMEVGDNYIPEMGFMSWLFHYDAVAEETYRIGYHHQFTRFAYKWYPKNEKIINFSLGFRNVMDFTLGDRDFFIWRFVPGASLSFANTSFVELNWARSYNELFFPFAFTDAEPLPAGEYHYNSVNLFYLSDIRKKISYELGFSYGGFYNGTRLQYSIDLRYRAQPWGNFAIAFEQNELKFPDPYGSRSLTLIGPKVEINFNNNLFWTTFLQYNTQSDNFNINSRFQWQFQPLSNIFLVYSDNYFIESFGPKNRAVVLKINYWLNI